MVDLSQIASVNVGGSPEDFVQKALTSDTTLTAAQYLSPSQAASFVRLVVDETVGLQMAQVVEVAGPSYEVSNMNIASGYYAVNLGGSTRVASGDEVTPNFDERILTPVPYDFRLPIETTILQRWNIEREGIQTTADQMLATYVANTLEDEAWNSVAGAAAPSWLTHAGTGACTTIDGWLQVAIQAGHTVDFNGARMGSEVFRRMLRALPTKWRGRGEQFYCNPNVSLEWNHFIYRNRTTNLGDTSMTNSDRPRFQGLPIMDIPKMREDYVGLGALSGSSDTYTKVLLTSPDNLVIGYNPGMRVYNGMRDDGKVAYVNYWGMFDVEIINVDAVVVGYNILPSAATSLE